MSAHNILKTAVCESISGRSTLTYQIAHEAELDRYFIRIVENTGNGYFSDDWLALDDVVKHIDKDGYITSLTINLLFKGKSANNGAFLLAALKQEEFIQTSESSKRSFVLNEKSSLLDELTILLNKPKTKRKGSSK